MRGHGGTCGSSARKLQRTRNRIFKIPAGQRERSCERMARCRAARGWRCRVPSPDRPRAPAGGGTEYQPANATNQPTAVTALNSPRRATRGRPPHEPAIPFAATGVPPSRNARDRDRRRRPLAEVSAPTSGGARYRRRRASPHARTIRHAPPGRPHAVTHDVAGARSASAPAIG